MGEDGYRAGTRAETLTVKKKTGHAKKKVSAAELEKLVSDLGRDKTPDITKYVGEDGFIRFSVESVRFRNQENGYSVLTVNVSGDAMTAVGIMPDVEEGDRIAAVCTPETNPRYGFQLHVTEYRNEIPSSDSDIEKYLASGAIKGIGPKTAHRIVAEFGEDTAGVIEKHPEWLAQVPGITPARAAQIHEEFARTADIRTVMAAFRDWFGPTLAMKIYNRFGKDAISVAEEDPFALAEEIDGIGFETVDAMASKKGMDKLAPGRIRSGVRFVLGRMTWRDGNTCVPYDELTAQAATLLGCPPQTVTDAVGSLLSAGQISVVRDADGRGRVYERRTYDDEKYIAMKLVSLCRDGDALGFQDIETYISISEAERNITYADGQRKAIFVALSRGVMVLTGGPGTGKTTVINALTGIFERLNMSIALAAPTGRAAKRMTEATGREARTVHRLLEVEYQGEDESRTRDLPEFRRNEKNPLDEDVVIVDECSMLDNALTAALLRAMRRGSRLILIGDSDQLPSVGPGSVLRDITASGAVPVLELDKVFRQAEQSLIVTNAHLINKGLMPVTDRRDGDFFFIRAESDQVIADTVCDLCARRLPAAYPGEPVQVVAPSKRGDCGTDRLNARLREMLNPEKPGKPEIKRESGSFRPGDRVMQVRNNYGMEWSGAAARGNGIFNGDIGRVSGVDPGYDTVTVDFDGRFAEYSRGDLADLEQAWAITVHKSQGSEYPIVVIPLGGIPPMLRTRNLLYTAVTRAVNRVIIVGREQVLAEMAATADRNTRCTGLCAMLSSLSGRKN